MRNVKAGASFESIVRSAPWDVMRQRYVVVNVVVDVDFVAIV